MSNVETTMTVPLTTTEFGTIRVGRSRGLDSVVHQYKQGVTVERIAESFASPNLADIYAVIAYNLANRESVEEYLRRQEAEADALQLQIEWIQPTRSQPIIYASAFALGAPSAPVNDRFQN